MSTVLRVAAIVAAAVLVQLLARQAATVAIRQLIERRAAEDDETARAELEQRMMTLQRLAVRVSGLLIGVIALLMVLDQVGIEIAPALAGLGVVGIAVGFGAQAIFRDWLAGIFIIVENQYSVGDVVTIAGVSGLVEDIGLRRTVLRDLSGTLHSVPNGEITVASNLTSDWSRVNLDLSVAYDTDIDHAIAVVDGIGRDLAADADWGPRLLEPPAVLRINSFDDSAVTLKVVGRVRPAEQWGVTGELRKRVLAAFNAEGIEIPFPHRVVVTRAAAGLPDEGPSKGDRKKTS
jgi:moderate conductance mechanosensitive channel